MQLDREGINDSKATTGEVDLQSHFKQHGLSNKAYQKMASDVESGDMNESILIECNENELNQIALQYNFT